MVANVKCSNCDTTMEPGFVPTSKGGASLYAASWHPGAPETDKSFWQKVRTGAAGAKLDEDELIPLVAYRCATCGLVSFYSAPPA